MAGHKDAADGWLIRQGIIGLSSAQVSGLAQKVV